MNPLTTKELSCLRWAAIGKTSWEMSMILGMAERTVNFHIQNACQKLQVRGRQAAITAVLQAGWLNVATEASPKNQKTRPPPALDKARRERLPGLRPSREVAAKP
ncbi:helix-turn-helix domain-containing protein [Paralcaligenes ureilyticus]|uniref:DNA-binding CsgD family transcriptional regulator n=1 Tax=Paralcaligenes ureilyticus TaxID=627131 RepID=A0A4R3M287_9BURK|nr:helix-turn-helix transcriptional regulator [Paralcaligenes ureilyticus]TCT07281.1 DNA-binding CsgD family transcriptional regulator [Paralcaligenes ureilyticus]